MKPGIYVVSQGSSGLNLKVWSQCFPLTGTVAPEWVRLQAENWRLFIAKEHPRVDIFLIEVLEPTE